MPRRWARARNWWNTAIVSTTFYIMNSRLSRSWYKGALVLALVMFAGGDLAALAFGSPPEPELTPEEHVREVLKDYPGRRGELVDIGSGPAVEILTRILNESGDSPGAILPP